MFKTALVLMGLIGFCAAQDTSTIVVKKSDLPTGLVQELEAKQTVQNIGKWAGMGKEIGVAMKEGLGALNDEVNRFADTKVGNFVILIIAFKVLGYPIIQLFVGLPLLIIGTTIFIVWFRKQCLPRRVCKSKTVTKKEGELFTTTTYTYDEEDPQYKEGEEVVGILVYMAYLALCIAIIFVH